LFATLRCVRYPFRDKFFHHSGDTPKKLDYACLARVFAELAYMVTNFATLSVEDDKH